MIKELGKRAKIASRDLAKLSSLEKNNILKEISKQLIEDRDNILQANSIDMLEGEKLGLNKGLLDRLLLTEERIFSMVESINKVIDLKDPIGKVNSMETMENGLMIGKKQVPIGVIAIIYEARPNVTLDCSILCLKSSNAIILRGGKEAIESNLAIVKSIRKAIKNTGYNEDFVQIVNDTSRESSLELMTLKEYIDLLIPRGSKSLIDTVVDNAKVPIIETGVGNCHIYIDESAKIDMAINIIENAKTQRIGVCNAMESLLVHENISDKFYIELKKLIDDHNLVVHGCKNSNAKLKDILLATDEDYYKEYLDYEFSIKVVSSIDEAIDHIEKYSTKHSDVIITQNYDNAKMFLDLVDSACVYVNASSRFTDGFEFGMGAEMGISTQKIHARGPIGLEELTSTKYIILGQGQIR